MNENDELEKNHEEAAEQTPPDAAAPEDLQAKYAELEDRYLRKAADFDNYRKRVTKEKQELSDFANQNLISDLLPVIDDFERALKAAESSSKSPADFDALYTGIKMTENNLYSLLETKWGLKRFDSAGALFDPERHEALMSEKSPQVKEATVAEDLIKGYTLKDRVIRSAKVKVLLPEG